MCLLHFGLPHLQKGNNCTYLHHFVRTACVLEPAQHQTNEYKIKLFLESSARDSSWLGPVQPFSSVHHHPPASDSIPHHCGLAWLSVSSCPEHLPKVLPVLLLVGWETRSSCGIARSVQFFTLVLITMRSPSSGLFLLPGAGFWRCPCPRGSGTAMSWLRSTGLAGRMLNTLLIICLVSFSALSSLF